MMDLVVPLREHKLLDKKEILVFSDITPSGIPIDGSPDMTTAYDQYLTL